MILHFDQPLIAWSVLDGHILRAVEGVTKKPAKWSKTPIWSIFVERVGVIS